MIGDLYSFDKMKQHFDMFCVDMLVNTHIALCQKVVFYCTLTTSCTTTSELIKTGQNRLHYSITQQLIK